ncbi:hypothetical protein HZA99_01145 [Candidatus Woesearchaeota archaeon]|nr:hypothetical protein [Candidatus Woesearchaeota archaeon]
MAVDRKKLRALIQYHIFEKEAFSQHAAGPDYDFFVSSAIPLFGGTLGGMRYNTGGELFPNNGVFARAADAGNVATLLQRGMTRKYTGDLIPRTHLQEKRLISQDESWLADFLGAKMVVRDKNPTRAQKVLARADHYDEEVQALFERAGSFVQGLNIPDATCLDAPNISGFYNTAPDSNTGEVKMTYVRRRTEHVHCLPENAPYFGSGNPSVVTATGVVGAIKALRERRFAEEDIINIGIRGGAGSVGAYIIQFLREYEASGYLGFKVNIKASDIERNRSELEKVAGKYDAIIVDDQEFRNVHMWVPSAFIGSVTPDVVDLLDNYTVIVGPENEQLPENPLNPHDPAIEKAVSAIYARLKEIEGYYSPDFVNNNGGIHDVNCRVMFGKEGYSKERAIQTMLEAGQAYVGAVHDRTMQEQRARSSELIQSHRIAEEMALDALVDRIIERRGDVLKGPFAAYFAAAL